MNIKEASNNLHRCMNELEFWHSLKELEFSKTQPQSFSYDEEKVQGGKAVNILERYVSEIEEIDQNISKLENEKNLLNKYINKELERINELEEPHKQILLLRDYGSTNDKRMTWDEIAKRVAYSKRQVIRIYNQNRKDGK